MNAARKVVIGVGNPYRRDDGAGPAVVERLRHRAAVGARLEESDGEPSQLLELWAGAELAIVVDAVRTGRNHPGRIHLRLVEDARPTGVAAPSSHRVDLGDAVALALAVDRMPATLVMYGIEVTDTSFGPGLSPAVEAAADEVAAAILDRLTDRSDPSDPSDGSDGSDDVPG
jgi:hydrogenase maturation protease